MSATPMLTEVYHIPPVTGELGSVGYIGSEPANFKQFLATGTLQLEKPAIVYAQNWSDPERPIGTSRIMTVGGHMVELSQYGDLRLNQSRVDTNSPPAYELLVDVLATVQGFGDVTAKLQDPHSKADAPVMDFNVTQHLAQTLEIILSESNL